MDLSLSMSNLSLFDNPRTSLAHLRRDGVHLTPKGQESVTKSWLVAVLTYFGLRRGTLHLRRDFARMQHDFLIYSQRRCMPAEPWGWWGELDASLAEISTGKSRMAGECLQMEVDPGCINIVIELLNSLPAFFALIQGEPLRILSLWCSFQEYWILQFCTPFFFFFNN